MFPFSGGLNGDSFGDDEYPWGGGEDGGYVRSSPLKTCNRCGIKDLRWLIVNGRWQLVYGHGNLKGKLHACPEK